MKRAITVLSLLFLFSSCVSEPLKVENIQTYSNSHYQFSVSYPESYTYCLNDFCFNEIPEEAIALFLLKNQFESKVLSMQVYVNLTGESAVDYGKSSLELNRKNSVILKEAYSEEKEISFAGEQAYTFLAKDGFEERGGNMSTDENGYIALVNDVSTEDSPTLSFTFPGQEYWVVYVEHGPYIYRIFYAKTTEMKGVMKSFEFIK